MELTKKSIFRTDFDCFSVHVVQRLSQTEDNLLMMTNELIILYY